MFLRRLKGQHQPGGEGLHPAAQDLGQDVQGLWPGAVSGDYLGYPGLPQPVGEGPDLLGGGVVQVEAPHNGGDGLAREGVRHFPDDVVRAPVAAAVEDHQALGGGKDQTLLVGKVIGKPLVPHLSVHVGGQAPLRQARRLVGQEGDAGEGREVPGDIADTGGKCGQKAPL